MQRVMAAMNGGTAAPAPRGRRRQARMRPGIQEGMDASGGNRMRPMRPPEGRPGPGDQIDPGFSPSPGHGQPGPIDDMRPPKMIDRQTHAQAPQRHAGLGGHRAGIAEGMQPELGHQLSRRVQQGSIDQEQAERTAGQRETIEAAFGDDWRNRLNGGQAPGGGIQRKTRMMAAGGDERAQAAAKLMKEARDRLLEEAIAKLKGGVAGNQAAA